MSNTTETEKRVGGDNVASVSSSVLSRIENEHLTPTPRSHFIFKESVVWSAGGLSVILGALGVAAIIFTARYSEWQYFDATHDNFFTFLVDIMPYTWILALVVFALLAYESVRHTRRGYRYHFPVLVLGSVGASIALGSVVYAFGAGPFIDRQIGSFIPLHRNLRDTKLGFWNQPERGIISGVVTEISPIGDEFILMSPSNESHSIRMDTLPPNIRETVVVGETMRVFAPFVEQAEFAAQDDSVSGTLVEEDIRTAMTAADVHQDSNVRMMSKAMPTTARMEMTQPQQVGEMQGGRKGKTSGVRTKHFLREACLVLPIHLDGDNDDGDYRGSIDACLKDIHRGERGPLNE